ncbi:MAG: YceI family protein [Bacteroidetes bacterium]|nr:MAG: YceI family protein [Bacteroidota bacterium]
MKKLILLSAIALFASSAFSPDEKKVSQKTHIKFFSSTPAEDIEAHNYKSVASLETETGEFVFSVPMQSFDFEKRLMQKHFNQEKFLYTQEFPKAKLVGKITNLEDIYFNKDGNYSAQIKGFMTIKGVSQEFMADAKIRVLTGKIDLDSKFMLTLADYGVAFEKGKPSTNIAKEVEVTVEANF